MLEEANELTGQDAANALPDSTPVAPEAAEPKPAPVSSPDIDAKLADWQAQMRREHAEEIERLRAEMAEEVKRTKQSFRDVGDSIVERVAKRMQNETGMLDELVRDGVLTQDDADVRKYRARMRIEQEENTSVQKERAASQAQFAQAEAQRVISTCTTALQNSGLVEGDPELASVPMHLPSDKGPDAAIQLYQDAVNKAKAAKAQRLANDEKAKAAKLKEAQAKAPIVDLGGAAPQPASTDIHHESPSDAYDAEWQRIKAGGLRRKRST